MTAQHPLTPPDELLASLRNSAPPQPVKPPLGLMPRYLMEEQRTIAILEAMLRYVNAGLLIPVEWTDELNDLASEKRWRSEYLVPEAPEATLNPGQYHG